MVPRNAVILGKISDLLASAATPGGSPQQRGLATAGMHHAQQHFDQRGLARPVGPQQPEDLAPPHFERDPGQSLDAAPPEQPVAVGLL